MFIRTGNQTCVKKFYTTSPKKSTYMQTFKQLAATFLNAIVELMNCLQLFMKTYNISTAMKTHSTLCNLLVHPKDRREPLNCTDVVYSIPCKNCDLTYVGELEGNLVNG